MSINLNINSTKIPLGKRQCVTNAWLLFVVFPKRVPLTYLQGGHSQTWRELTAQPNLNILTNFDHSHVTNIMQVCLLMSSTEAVTVWGEADDPTNEVTKFNRIVTSPEGPNKLPNTPNKILEKEILFIRAVIRVYVKGAKIQRGAATPYDEHAHRVTVVLQKYRGSYEMLA